MTNAQVKQWLEAMRSGKYTFARTVLEYDGRYCSLGVLSKEFRCYSKNTYGELRYPSEYVSYPLETILIALNDCSSTHSYQEVIADIEGALEDYITE